MERPLTRRRVSLSSAFSFRANAATVNANKAVKEVKARSDSRWKRMFGFSSI